MSDTRHYGRPDEPLNEESVGERTQVLTNEERLIPGEPQNEAIAAPRRPVFLPPTPPPSPDPPKDKKETS
jgi:hypothetical protein